MNNPVNQARIRAIAEDYYRTIDCYRSEARVKTFNEEFAPGYPDGIGFFRVE